jgi:hypothetical protein
MLGYRVISTGGLAGLLDRLAAALALRRMRVHVAPRLASHGIVPSAANVQYTYSSRARTRLSPGVFIGLRSGVWPSRYLMPAMSATHSTAYAALQSPHMMPSRAPEPSETAIDPAADREYTSRLYMRTSGAS